MESRTSFIKKPLALVIASTLSVSAFADEENQQFDEQMVVTATRTEVALDKAPASMTVISSEEIENNPSLTLADIVSEATSVESTFDGTRAGRQQISIRGMDAKYTLIMVNGRRMSSASAIVRGNDFNLSTIPMDSIERVEIIRGPMSALYGSDGMGGTINIITKTPTNEWNSTVNMDVSSPLDGDGGEEYKVGFTTSGALIEDELFARLTVNQSSREAWKPYSGTKEWTSGGQDHSYDRSKITALEERDVLSVFGSLSWNMTENQMLDFDFGYSDDERDTVAESENSVIESDSKVRRNNQALTHTGFWTWGDSQVRYSRELVDNIEGASDDDGVTSDIEELTQIFEASANTYLDSHTITVGFDYQMSELTNKVHITGGNADAYQWAIYAQDQWDMSENWTATIGGRLDKHEFYGEEFSPRVYLVNQTTQNLVLKGGVGKAFKAPTLVQNHPDFMMGSCKGNCNIYGNPDLKPETSLNYELAAIYSEASWRVEGALFRNEIEDMIAAYQVDPSDSNSDKSYENVDEAVIQGAEISGQIDVTEQVSLSGNYTYLDTEDKTTGEELEERYKHSGFAKLAWTPTYDLSTFVSMDYKGERKLERGDDITQDAMTLFNLGAVYHVNSDMRLRAGIRNLTNESVSDELVNLGYVEEPRTYYVGLTADF